MRFMVAISFALLFLRVGTGLAAARDEIAASPAAIMEVIDEVREAVGLDEGVPVHMVMVFSRTGQLVFAVHPRSAQVANLASLQAAVRQNVPMGSVSHAGVQQVLSAHGLHLPSPVEGELLTILEIDFPLTSCDTCPAQKALVESAKSEIQGVRVQRLNLGGSTVAVPDRAH